MDKRVKFLITIGILLLIAAILFAISYAITKSTGFTITGKVIEFFKNLGG